jgi:AmmeMemoRadiSam system protein B
MTHNEPAAEAMRKDEAVLEVLELFDAHELFEICLREHITMCGRAGVAIAIEAAKRLGANGIRVVDYRHSGFVTGNNGSVVGYAGVIIS